MLCNGPSRKAAACEAAGYFQNNTAPAACPAVPVEQRRQPDCACYISISFVAAMQDTHVRALQLAGLDERRAGARDRVHRALWRVIPYLQRGGKNARRNHLIAVDLCALPGEKTANGGLLQAAAVRACCSCPSSGSRPTGASSAGLQRRIGSNKKGEELQGECAPVATAATAPSPRWSAGLRITKCRKNPAEAIESTSLKHASINILKGYGAPCLQTKSPLLRRKK